MVTARPIALRHQFGKSLFEFLGKASEQRFVPIARQGGPYQVARNVNFDLIARFAHFGGALFQGSRSSLFLLDRFVFVTRSLLEANRKRGVIATAAPARLRIMSPGNMRRAVPEVRLFCNAMTTDFAVDADARDRLVIAAQLPKALIAIGGAMSYERPFRTRQPCGHKFAACEDRLSLISNFKFN